MRGNMDPLAPTTHTLGPAIAHIAETAASLSSSMQNLQNKPEGLGIDIHVSGEPQEEEAATRKRKQQETVKWVLGTPRRLRDLMDQEQEEEAAKEWEEVSKILDKWNNVAGVEDLRAACESILNEDADSG
jgi:hypothetical protein